MVMSTELFKDLIITEKELLQEAVGKAKDLVAIEEKSGRVILRVPRQSLGQRQIVALYLAGQYFANQMNKVKSSSLSITELEELTGIDPNTLAGRLSELVRDEWARRLDRARYEINQFALNAILDDIGAFKRKSEFLQPLETERSEETNQVSSTASFPIVPKTRHLTESILYALGSEWGKTPRDWGEIAEALKQNALHYSKGSVTGTLTLLTQSGKVRRIKYGHSYKYVLR